MASTSVFDLTAFTALASGDVIPVVDVSDTTQSSDGSLKKITVANVFASVPVAVSLASTLSVTGATTLAALTATTGTFTDLLQVTKTTQQLSLRYDGSNHFGVTVSNTGVATLTSTGSAPEIQLTSAFVLRASATGVGFHNTAPIAQPSVTGSRASNAALASLLTALANYGLVADNTSA